MQDREADGITARDDELAAQPLGEGDATSEADDPAEEEWELTQAIDEGVPEEELDPGTATGADPNEIPSIEDDVPGEDLPTDAEQPESQSDDPVIADLGEEGEGDLSPEDL